HRAVDNCRKKRIFRCGGRENAPAAHKAAHMPPKASGEPRKTDRGPIKKSLFRQQVPGFLPVFFHLHALYHQHQLRPADQSGGRAARRGYEGPLIESLVIHHEAAAISVKELEKIPVPVQEHVYLPGGGILSHAVPDQPRQPVEALAHVHRLPVKIIPVGGAEAEHQQRRTSPAISERSDDAAFSFTPLVYTSPS